MALLAPAVLVSLCAYGADLAGEYAGTWTSDGGSSDGKLHFAVKKTAGTWDCKLAYSGGDQSEITPKPVSCTIDGNKLKAQYEGEGDAGVMHFTLDAALTGSSLEGTYTVAGGDGQAVDSGKWKASATH